MTSWDGYVPFDPGVSAPLRELPRTEARAAYKRLMAAKAARVEALRELLRRNGVVLGTSDQHIRALTDWFRREVEPDATKPGRLRPLWYAVVNDVALFLGDLIIERNPGVHWVFLESPKSSASYQCHVLMGFPDVSDPKYHVDIDMVVASLGYRVIGGHSVEADFLLRVVRGR